MFQRFADARTALASGDIDITAFGPQDISLALGQGAQDAGGRGRRRLRQRLPDRAQGRGHQGLEGAHDQGHRRGRRLDLVAEVRRLRAGERRRLRQAQDRQHHGRRRQLPEGAPGQGDRHGRGVAALLRPGHPRRHRPVPDHRPQQVEDGGRAHRGARRQPRLHGEAPRRRAAPGRRLRRRAQVRAGQRGRRGRRSTRRRPGCPRPWPRSRCASPGSIPSCPWSRSSASASTSRTTASSRAT